MTAALSFRQVTIPPENRYLCGICYKRLNKKDSGSVIVHEGEEGAKHPLHAKCMQMWIKQRPTCPYCEAQVDEWPLLSWKDKISLTITNRWKSILYLAGEVFFLPVGGDLEEESVDF